MVERIAELVREKRIEGIGDLRDESDRTGMRVVIELKRDAGAEVVLNQLYRFTPLQSSFAVNALALNRGRPQQMGLRDMLAAFVDFREEVVVRRTRHELSKARDRGHVLVGLAIAVANIDEVIHIIRSSKDPAEARERLAARDWPIGDMIALIEPDRRSAHGGGRRRPGSADRRTGPRHPGPDPVAPDGPRPRRNLRRGDRTGRRHPRPPGSAVVSRGDHGGGARRTGRGPRGLRRAAPQPDRRGRRRRRGRGPDRPRGDGHHRHPRRLCQAHRR